MTFNEIEKQLLSVVCELGVSSGRDDCYVGKVREIPFLIKLISEEPPAYMIKLRVKEPTILDSKWPATLSNIYENANIGCEIEDDYLFLWIRDSSALSSSNIVSLVHKCIERHANYFPDEAGYCFDCGEHGDYGSSLLTQSGSSITAICQTCIEQRAEEQIEVEQRLNESKGSLVLLLPLAITFSIVGWALFWQLCNIGLAKLHLESIQVPKVALAIVGVMIAIFLGWPVGKLLHKSGVVKHISALTLSILVATITLMFGEILSASYVIYQVTGVFDIEQILNNTFQIFHGEDEMYALLKLVYAASLGAMIFDVSKLKQAKFKL